ncbi:MAG TPA: hypothetical protein VL307_13505, partial [Chitinophagaceae bacterium]|nr:hypothetical protein [Chitinophagaceae bacterium]
MRSTTLKWMLLMLTVLAAVVLLVQLYWINTVYYFEQNVFNTNVVKSIRGVFEDMHIDDNPGTQLQKLIERPNPSSFIIRVDTLPQRDSLINFFYSEFEDFNVFTDCKMAVYSDSAGRFLYQAYLPSAATTHLQTSNHPRYTSIDLAAAPRDYSYILLYFPHRQQYIIHQL